MLLVTGASGHSGTWFFKKLIAHNYQGDIRCTVRSSSNIDLLKNSQLKVEFIEGDLKDFKFTQKAMKDVDVVVNFTGIKCTKNIINACKIHPVSWFISVHTTSCFSKYQSLSATYNEIEQFVFSSGVDYTLIRPTMIYGSSKDRNMWKLLRFINRYKFFPVFGRGENLLQPIHAKDLGEAVYAIFLCNKASVNKAYNVAGKSVMTYKELLETVSKKLNRKVYFIYIPFFISILLVKFYSVISKKPYITIEQVMRVNEDKNFDYSEATQDFGFSPMSFDEGIDSEIEEFLSKSSE